MQPDHIDKDIVIGPNPKIWAKLGFLVEYIHSCTSSRGVDAQALLDNVAEVV